MICSGVHPRLRGVQATLSLTAVALFLPALFGASDLNGIVLTPKNKAVQKALVGVHRSSVDGPLPKTESHHTVTDGNGRFQISGLQDGPYIVCVVASGQDLLDPCQWTIPTPVVRMPSGAEVKV